MDLESIDRHDLGVVTTSPAQILAERYALLSRVADGIAHEVKNPIHAAVINLELLRRWATEPNPEEVRERLDLIEEELVLIHELIDTFFNFLRPRKSETVHLDLTEVIGRVDPLLRAYCRVSRVELEYGEIRNTFIRAEPAAIEQIVLTLMTAVVETLTPTGGRVRVSAAEPDESDGEIRLEIRGWRGNRRAHDPSQDEEERDQTSDPKIYPKLAIAKHLAEINDARIEVREIGDHDAQIEVRLTLDRVRSA